MRNALIPILTIIGVMLPDMVGARRDHRDRLHLARPRARGSCEAANGRDFPVIMGIALVFAIVVLSANLLTDVAYAAADPRIRY